MIWISLAGVVVAAAPEGGRVVEVGRDEDLRQALAALENGTTLKIAPGQYRGGLTVRGVRHLVVEAADPNQPPEFFGGSNAWHFPRCHNLVILHLVCRARTGNGLNIDDGGKMNNPVRGVRIERVTALETGLRGNFDGIKCSGLDGLVIAVCRVESWGGHAIDLVGCCNMDNWWFAHDSPNIPARPAGPGHRRSPRPRSTARSRHLPSSEPRCAAADAAKLWKR